MSRRTVEPAELHAAIVAAGSGAAELAVLDVREEGVFGAGHLLRAVNIPLSRFELAVRQLVPRRETPVVLMDGGPDGDPRDAGLAERAAALMEQAGYRDVALLEGGVPGWVAAGCELFSGLNVPSKVFGEYIEHRFGTPRLGAEELKAKLDAGENLVVLDSRPFEEYHAMNIPTGIDVPGAELVHRVRALAPDPGTTVVVNCAGRTRSIIGAQSLVNAGLENPVYALENGTMGWHLAGLTLETGRSRRAPDPDSEARAWGEAAARAVAERFGVGEIDAERLAAFRAETGRTTYLLDVRGPEEFAAGHRPGAVSAPGGQLVQATDRYVGTLGARLVLCDDTGTRARMTASWLLQMGWPEVHVLADGPGDDPTALETGPGSDCVPELAEFAQSFITADDLAALGEDVPVVDLSTSLRHKRGHVPGARFAIRADLKSDIAEIATARLLVLTAADERIARLAANDLTRAGIHRVRVLKGGTAAWSESGRDLESGMAAPLSDPTRDVYERPYDLEDGVEAAMRAYLDWEIALIRQIERDGTLRFPDFAP